MNNHLIDIRPYDERCFCLRQLIGHLQPGGPALLIYCGFFMEVNFIPVSHEAS